ncbi:MAG: MFS transporter [Pseudomonadota bacterium]|nr:MFS transporter [Pseudomonadota bacterium]
MGEPNSLSSIVHEQAGKHRWAMLGGVWLLYFCFGLSVASLAPLVAPIEADLHIDHALMGTILGAWPVVYIIFSAPCGSLLDRFGARRMLFVSATIIAIAIALRGFASSYIELLLTMVLFGIGGPIISSGAPKVVSLWFKGKDRGLGTGIYFTGNALGGITALSLTNSVFMPYFNNNWREVFFGYAIFIFLSGCCWLLINSHPVSKNLEKRSIAEKGVKHVKVFLELIKHPIVKIVLAIGIFMLFFGHGMNQWLPTILLQTGMSIVEAGYWASIPAVIGLMTAPFINRLATPERRLQILIALFVVAGLATLVIYSQYNPILVIGLIFLGVCRGAMNGIAVLILMDNDKEGSARVGAAVGLYFSAAEIGGALGPMTVGVLAKTTGSFQAPLLMMTTVTVLLILMALKLKKVMKKSEKFQY